MKFEWDPKKAASNQLKHRVRFEEAITAFDDPFTLRAGDPKHSRSEIRQWLIGMTDPKRLVVIIFTERRKATICRIISARLANRRERALYETYKRIPV